MNTLVLPNRKQIRAQVIKKYVDACGYPGVVCFSCGNAAMALREAGVETVMVTPGSMWLQWWPWWTAWEIHRQWPNLLDATSGHLPIPVMQQIALALRENIGDLPEDAYMVPTGSGETILCLRWAYSGPQFIPVYNTFRGTKYEPLAPLNDLVENISPLVFYGRSK